MKKQIEFQKLISDITGEQWNGINKLVDGLDESQWLDLYHYIQKEGQEVIYLKQNDRGPTEKIESKLIWEKYDEQTVEQIKASKKCHGESFKSYGYFYLIENNEIETDKSFFQFGLPFNELLDFDDKIVAESNLDYYDICIEYIYLEYLCKCLKKIYNGIGLNNERLFLQIQENKPFEYSYISAFLNFHLKRYTGDIARFQFCLVCAVCTNLRSGSLPDADIRKIIFEWIYENSLRYSITPPPRGYVLSLDEDEGLDIHNSEEITYPNQSFTVNVIPSTNNHFQKPTSYEDFVNGRETMYSGTDNIKKKKDRFSLNEKLVLLDKLGLFGLAKVKNLTNEEQSRLLEKIIDNGSEYIRTRLSSIGKLEHKLSGESIRTISSLLNPD